MAGIAANLHTLHSFDLAFRCRDSVFFLSLRLIAKLPARLTAYQMARVRSGLGQQSRIPVKKAETSVIGRKWCNTS
jgi:hypothetical protein